jgi:hypothetical protein
MNRRESYYLKVLEQVVKKYYPARRYKIGGYQEESLCIEKNNDEWIVYNGERGNHYNKQKLPTVEEACNTFVMHLTHNEHNRAELMSQINNIVDELRKD